MISSHVELPIVPPKEQNIHRQPYNSNPVNQDIPPPPIWKSSFQGEEIDWKAIDEDERAQSEYYRRYFSVPKNFVIDERYYDPVN